MFYAYLKDTQADEFKRATGVSDLVFAQMVQTYQKRRPKTPLGRPRRLSDEDEMLLTLMYWREYRSHFHIAQTYQVSEATARRIIRQVETALLQDPGFHLPGKKRLLATPSATRSWEGVVVDVTECAIERPQKSRSGITVERRSGTPRRRN